MGVKQVIKKGFFSGLNPLRWLGYEQILQNGKIIKRLVDRAVQPESVLSAPHSQTFEENMQRFGLTEETLKKRMKSALYFVTGCLLLSMGLLAYAIYLLIVPHLFVSAFVCIILMLLLWAYAFREHFNYFQMKERRLGCTFKEWLAGFFKGKQ